MNREKFMTELNEMTENVSGQEYKDIDESCVNYYQEFDWVNNNCKCQMCHGS